MPNRRDVKRACEDNPSPIIMFRPVDARRARAFHQQCDLLVLPRKSTLMGLLAFKQTSAGLVSKDFHFHPGPIDLRVRLSGTRWNQLLAPAAIPNAADATLRCETLEVIVIERDAAKQQTSIRVASKGKTVMTFIATGPVDAPMTVVHFESDRKYASLVKKQTISSVQATLLRLADAKPRQMAVEVRDNITLLRAVDGQPFNVKDLDEAYRVNYVVVSAAESPASVSLQSAIDNADPAGVRKAIRQGADLRFLPDAMCSPLHWSLLKRKGDWLGCVRALFDACASVGTGPYTDPAICIAVDVNGAKEGSTIELIDYLLRRGESIEARGKSAARVDMTPLHVAAKNGLLGVVAHLLKRGADVRAQLANGIKASDLPRPWHTFLGDEHVAVKQLLLAVERGELRPAVLKSKAIAQQADRMRNGVKYAIRDWARANDSPIAALFAADGVPLNPTSKGSRRSRAR